MTLFCFFFFINLSSPWLTGIDVVIDVTSIGSPLYFSLLSFPVIQVTISYIENQICPLEVCVFYGLRAPVIDYFLAWKPLLVPKRHCKRQPIRAQYLKGSDQWEWPTLMWPGVRPPHHINRTGEAGLANIVFVLIALIEEVRRGNNLTIQYPFARLARTGLSMMKINYSMQTL